MSYHGNTLADVVLEGRRAVYWHYYCSTRRATLMGYRSHGPKPKWSVRVAHPQRQYARSAGKGPRGFKNHLVRDQLVGTRRGYPEARMTRYRCGAFSWQAELEWSATTVCAQCLLVAEGCSIVEVAS